MRRGKKDKRELKYGKTQRWLTFNPIIPSEENIT